MGPAFVGLAPLSVRRRQQSTRKESHYRRACICANINGPNSAREDEIAAKIAKLRKQNRLKSQKSTPQGANENRDEANSQSIGSFNDLPDWKKTEILESQMAEAENFLNPGPSVTPDSKEEEYRPAVSTWGVYPRPDNISKAFGGGRKIAIGGQKTDTPESKASDAEVEQKLLKYRKSVGIDMELEGEHQEEIEAAMVAAKEYMSKTLPYDAVDILLKVKGFVSSRSRLGGDVYLQLALAHEAVGQRDEARSIYKLLKRSPFSEISSKAKQLLAGFAAMEHLKVDDETARRGYRVTEFTLPDMVQYTGKRYETSLGVEPKSSLDKKRDLEAPESTRIVLLLLIVVPALLVLVLMQSSR